MRRPDADHAPATKPVGARAVVPDLHPLPVQVSPVDAGRVEGHGREPEAATCLGDLRCHRHGCRCSGGQGHREHDGQSAALDSCGHGSVGRGADGAWRRAGDCHGCCDLLAMSRQEARRVARDAPSVVCGNPATCLDRPVALRPRLATGVPFSLWHDGAPPRCPMGIARSAGSVCPRTAWRDPDEHRTADLWCGRDPLGRNPTGAGPARRPQARRSPGVASPHHEQAGKARRRRCARILRVCARGRRLWI